MNKALAEKKFYAFHAVFRVDVNDVKPFQNPDPQSMPRLLKATSSWSNQILFLLILFQHFTTGVRLFTRLST